MPEIQTSRREFIGTSAALVGGLAFAEGGEWKAAYPEQIAEVEWLRSHQRACFGIDDKTVVQAMKDGVNVVIGGTNAGGPNGFAGGHWVLNKSGDGFVAVLTGTPMEPRNLERIKHNVKEVHRTAVRC